MSQKFCNILVTWRTTWVSQCDTIMSICIYIYIYIVMYAWISVRVRGWVAKERILSTASLKRRRFSLVWFVGFYGISTPVGYLTPNPFLCKWSVLLKTIQFSIGTQFNCQKHFHFKLFKQLYVTIQLSVSTILMSKNSSISNNSNVII